MTEKRYAEPLTAHLLVDIGFWLHPLLDGSELRTALGRINSVERVATIASMSPEGYHLPVGGLHYSAQGSSAARTREILREVPRGMETVVMVGWWVDAQTLHRYGVQQDVTTRAITDIDAVDEATLARQLLDTVKIASAEERLF